MYVEKIEIPAFRVLRDVVLDFTGGYDPQVFPLGSKNGGGKSTLLQLVFMLLSARQMEFPSFYIGNLLTTDSYTGTESQRTLARVTIRTADNSRVLEFLSLSYGFLAEKLPDPPQHGFGTKNQKNLLRERTPTKERSSKPYEDQRQALDADWARIHNLLLALNYAHIANYSPSASKSERWNALVCHIRGQTADETKKFHESVGEKTFLLGPSNQQYLFLSKKERRALLGLQQRQGKNDPNPKDNDGEPNPPESPQVAYAKALTEAESELRGFYAYDWLSIEPLIRLFKKSKDEDFEVMVRTGTYGNKYPSVLAQVNELLSNKKVRPLPDLSGVEFLITDAQGNETILHPSDLSQGELKRLLIFAWLRANNATDALVLIDEIETSFHPDWQVGIVRDLQDWGPQNQYILATHSYELCQALTPRHVKELEPRLAQKDAGSSNA